MDEYTAHDILKKLYKLENRSVKLGTEESYVKRHMDIITKDSNGKWDDDIAKDYIDSLEQSV